MEIFNLKNSIIFGNLDTNDFNETLINGWIKKIIINIANKYPYYYETYFSHLYPLDDITYYLTKI